MGQWSPMEFVNNKTLDEGDFDKPEPCDDGVKRLELCKP